MSDINVELVNITKEFSTRGGKVKAVDDVSLQIEQGEFFALLGPSGCGKTTTLRLIAGFEPLTSGQILIRGEPMQHIPAFHRPVNTVFQDYALFPHMTALQNVMFGLRKERMTKAEAKKRALETLEKVQLPQVTDRRPLQLSGGQQQRVALARALVKNPTVLLLDESLSALDQKLREEMRYELKTLQRDLGKTFIFVTHDQAEALTMADRIAVMNLGQVLQVGTPEEIYEEPRTRFVAEFIGETNFITGKLEAWDGHFGIVRLPSDISVGAVLDDDSISIGSEVTIAIRPEKLSILPSHGKILRNATVGSVLSGIYKKLASEDEEEILEDRPTRSIHIEEIVKFADEATDIVSIPGMVKRATYMGTDTRYTVSLGRTGFDLTARVQNFQRRFGPRFEIGQQIDVYWNYENARILRD